MKKIIIYILFSIIHVSLSKIAYSLESASSQSPQSFSSTAFDLNVEDQVGIFQTEGIQVLRIEIKSSQKLKREAYEGLNKKRNEVIRILSTLLVIPDPSTIKLSKIRQLFSEKKRKWEFRMVLTLCVFSSELSEVISRLQRSIKIESLKTTTMEEQHLHQKQLLILAKYQLIKQNAQQYLNSQLGNDYHLTKVSEYNFQIPSYTKNQRSRISSYAEHRFSQSNQPTTQNYLQWLRQVKQIEMLKIWIKFMVDTRVPGMEEESEEGAGLLEQESQETRSEGEQSSSFWEQDLII